MINCSTYFIEATTAAAIEREFTIVYNQDKRESTVKTLVACKKHRISTSYRAISAAISLVNCTNSATESCSGRFVKSGCARNSA